MSLVQMNVINELIKFVSGVILQNLLLPENSPKVGPKSDTPENPTEPHQNDKKEKHQTKKVGKHMVINHELQNLLVLVKIKMK